MMDPYQKITRYLTSNRIQFIEFNHIPIFSMDESSKVNGLNLKSGAKSLILRSKNEYLLVVLPGDKRLDSKKLKIKLGTKNLRFATPAEVYTSLGCIVGACYPFGSLANIRTLIDMSYKNIGNMTFNPGVHTKTISMSFADYFKLEQPETCNVAA